ncbi:MAG TPA: tRNA (adenosine(37)-N6)-threonylcarbamoyltransferase complex dimerization subunit type 1 TsaB [Acidimicrobiia bacterium]|nr:tRNA (adenosine(37)-N6)-threonylcarbamoyltransferase complex dimerization subunit type 1 TsaB [Acidimicrobiia bacterium]
MKVLAIETATAASSVALADDGGVVASARRVDRRGHVGFLVPALDFCFAQAGWSPTDVDLVAVDVGPGLFSGIRTGLATAQAVASAIGAPLVPVTSLDAVALRAATGHRRIWSVVDVRRKEVVVGPYRPVPGGVVRDGANELCSPAAFRAILEGDPADVLVVGDWRVLPDGVLLGLHAIKTGRPRYPSADAVAEIARARAQRGELPHPDEVRPRYMREPDVTINWADFRSEGPWT